MLEKSVLEFLNLAASKTPVPGGGSIAALSGALGCAMGHMAAIFSTSKKYEAVAEQISKILGHFQPAIQQFAMLVDEDANAYEVFSKAMKMPKNTEAEKAKRRTSMQFAIGNAIATPRKICHLAVQSLEVANGLVDIGNKNLISDVGVCGTMLLAAFNGARLNVEINLAFTKDKEAVVALRAEMDELSKKANELADAIYSKTIAQVRGTGK